MGKGKLYKRGRVQTIFTALFAIAITFTPAAFAQTDITSEFTDENFRNKVCTAISKSAGCTILNTEVQAITTLSVSNSNIASLAGIEYFTALTNLQVADNQLTEIDVSKNTALEVLWFERNQLTEIDVSKNTSIQTLYVHGNQLTEIDVSNNTSLSVLSIPNNQLTEIDVSKNTSLSYLYVFDNKLTELDVSKNTALTMLQAYNNQLTELDVSKNTKLNRLYVYNNKLTSLDVSGLDNLSYFDCSYNYLKEVIGWDGDIGEQKELYTVTVTGGTGGGNYEAGETVTITATVPSGKVFKNWTATGATLANANNATTTFTMPATAVAITAVFVDTYVVTITGGTGSGEYATGETVTITATVPSGKVFKNWTATGATLANANSATTTFTMPATAVTITAVFEDDSTDPIRTPQIASSNIHAYAMGNNIVLQNLPSGAKVEVFGLSGKLITTSHSPLATSHLGVQTISVHTKGIYIVKTGTQIFRVAVK